MKLLIFILFLLPILSYSQPSDFILLKKKDRTIASYYAGNHINFTTIDGASIDADISSIHGDTLYLQQYIIQQVPTTLGVYILDTTGSYHFKYSYKQIKSINKTSNQFDFSSSGSSLIGGGIVLVVVSSVVYLVDRGTFSPALMIAGAALAGAGYFISKANWKKAVMGKKYSLIYIRVGDEKR